MTLPEIAVSEQRLPNVPLTLELDGRHDLDRHDGFKNHRLGASERVFERANSSEPEGKLGRILNVRSAVLQNESTAVDGVTGQHAPVQSLVETLEAVSTLFHCATG
jgi:hypothetical protein